MHLLQKPIHTTIQQSDTMIGKPIIKSCNLLKTHTMGTPQQHQYLLEHGGHSPTTPIFVGTWGALPNIESLDMLPFPKIGACFVMLPLCKTHQSFEFGFEEVVCVDVIFSFQYPRVFLSYFLHFISICWWMHTPMQAIA